MRGPSLEGIRDGFALENQREGIDHALVELRRGVFSQIANSVSICPGGAVDARRNQRVIHVANTENPRSV